MVSPKPKNSGNPRAGGSVTGWLALVFTASACMFILGVLVGRNTAPVHFDMENLDKKLSQLEESVVAESPGQSAGPGGEKIPEDLSFEFYDKLKEKEEIDEHAAGRPRVLTTKYNKPPPSEIQVAQAGKNADGEKAQKPKAAEPAPPRKPADKQYAIQVASLRNIKRAHEVREKFAAKGYPAFTQLAVVEGKGRYCRVRLGPYDSRSQAENDLRRLQKAGVDAMIFLNDADF